jgi:hypothetical protein
MFFNENTVKLMKEIVPEYVSNNSELCKLDKKEMGKPSVKTIDSPEILQS